MDLKAFVLVLIIVGSLEASSAHQGINKKSNSHLYSKLLSDLKPQSVQHANTLNYLNMKQNQLSEENIERSRNRRYFSHGHREAESLCESRKETIDRSIDPDYEYMPPKYYNYHCTETISQSPIFAFPSFKSECHTKVNIPTACKNIHHQVFVFRRPKRENLKENLWEFFRVEDSIDCQCHSIH